MVTLVVACLVTTEAFAAGFYLPGRGVRPMGRAGAFVASGEGDLNSLWYNPANLALLPHTKLTVDVAGLNLGFRFQRAPRTTQSGATVEYGEVRNSAPPELIPQLSVGGPTGVDKLSWAAGFYAPYMSGSTCPASGPQRYTLISNDGSVLAFLNATLAYQIGDAVRIGAGFVNVIGAFQVINVTSGYTGLYGRPEDEDLDILSKIELHSYFNPAANIGLWAKLADNVQMAVSFQTPTELRDDDAKLTVRMPSSPAFDNARLTNNTLAASMQLPAVVRVGLRYVHQTFDIELAGVWEGWSVFEELQAEPNDIEVEGVPGIGSIPVGPLNVPEHYQDTFSVRLGGDYHLDPDWSLRTGYAWEKGAIRDSYYSVFSPDSDKHLIAGGLSWSTGSWTLDASAAYYVFADRHIEDSQVRQINPTDADKELATVVGNGDYSASYFVFGLGVNYAFE